MPLFLIACPTLLANSSNAIQLFNKRLPEICEFLRRVFTAQSTHALLCLVHLLMAIKFSIARFPRDKDELSEKAALIERMIIEVLRCNAFDDLDNVLKLLLPSIRVIDRANVLSASSAKNSPATKQSTRGSTPTTSASDMDENVQYLRAAHALQQDQLLGLCLKHELKTIFGCSQVSSEPLGKCCRSLSLTVAYCRLLSLTVAHSDSLSFWLHIHPSIAVFLP